jgi:hypothetical protein
VRGERIAGAERRLVEEARDVGVDLARRQWRAHHHAFKQ